MKRSLSLLSVFLIASIAAAQKDGGKASGPPPLIDRDVIFGNPEIAAAQLSPNGNYIAFLKPWNDTRNVYVKAVGEPFSAARLLTTESKRPVAGYLWTRDSKYILYVKDHDGDENFNVYAVDPSATPAPGADAPPSRDLTGLKGVRVVLYEVPKSDPDIVYIGLNDRDKAWHDLYRLKISTGKVSGTPLEVERRFSDPIRIESGCESCRKGENRRGETLSQQVAEEHHHDSQERHPGAGPFSEPEWAGAVADGGTDRAVSARRG